MYEYYHHEDIPALAESHKVALQGTDQVTTSIYRLRTKDNGFINVQSEWKSFRNPWTKDVEYLIAKNNVILSDLRNFDNKNQGRGEDSTGKTYNFLEQCTGIDSIAVNHLTGISLNICIFAAHGRESMHRMINTHVEASKIGRQIAEHFQRRLGDSSSGSSPDPDPTISLAQTVPIINENQLGATIEHNLDRRSNGSTSNSQNSGSQRINGSFINHQKNNSIAGSDNSKFHAFAY